MMDKTAIDDALQEIKYMVQFAVVAAESMLVRTDRLDVFQMPIREGNQLGFCINEIERRVEELIKAL